MRRIAQIVFPPCVRTYPKSTSAEFFVPARTKIAVKLSVVQHAPERECSYFFGELCRIIDRPRGHGEYREILPPPLESKWMIVASHTKENHHHTLIVKKGPPPPNEPLQLCRGAQQYRAQGHGEHFDTMEFFIA